MGEAKKLITIWVLVFLISSSVSLLLDNNARGDSNNIIETEHFIITYQEGALSIAQEVASIAEIVYSDATEFMNFTPTWKMNVIVNHTVEPHSDNFYLGGEYFGRMGFAFNESLIRLYLPPLWSTESLGSTEYRKVESVFAHELNHMLLMGDMQNTWYLTPRWYFEGLASFYQISLLPDYDYTNLQGVIYRAIQDDILLLLDDMFGPAVTKQEYSLPYVEGISIFVYIENNYGTEKIEEMIQEFSNWNQGETTTQNLDRLFTNLFNETRHEFEAKWIYWLENDFAKELDQPKDLLGTRITNSTMIKIPTSWSERGILYLDGTNGSLDIYLINETGGSPIRLTYENGTDSDAKFSPDGARIVFTSLRNGTHDLYLMNNDGTGLKRLTNDSYINVAPDWSLDGEKIIFVSDRYGNYDIFELNIASGSIVPIIVSPYNDGAPTYSPEGAKIAFNSNRTGNFSIQIFDINTREITKLTDDDTSEWFPSWSPDGESIAFLKYSEDGGVFIHDIGSENQIKIAGWDYWNSPMSAAPVWSPDSKQLGLGVMEWTSAALFESNIYIIDTANSTPGFGFDLILIAVIIGIMFIRIKHKKNQPV